MSGNATLENVRRYRATASLYRQTAVFRPLQKFSLLEQAYEWERRAIAELEAHFTQREASASPMQSWMVPATTSPMLHAA